MASLAPRDVVVPAAQHQRPLTELQAELVVSQVEVAAAEARAPLPLAVRVVPEAMGWSLSLGSSEGLFWKRSGTFVGRGYMGGADVVPDG